MWVRLRYYGYQACLNTVLGDRETWEELQVHAVHPPHKRWEIEAPYVAWKTVRDRLYERSYGPRGGKLAYGKQANYAALEAIQKELNYIDTHPAKGGYAMFGIHFETFPVWKLNPTPRWPQKYSSYPQPGCEFVILTPKMRKQTTPGRLVDLTYWVESSTGEGRLADEAVHLRLRRHSIR